MRMTVTQEDVDDGDLGICLICGEFSQCIAPDMRWAECEHCGCRNVFGIKEAVLMDYVDLIADEDSH